MSTSEIKTEDVRNLERLKDASLEYGRALALLGITPCEGETRDLAGSGWGAGEYPFIHHYVVAGYSNMRKNR